MSQYYNAPRTRGLFNPNSQEPFKLSRSKIELFLDCPRCFYLDVRLGVGRPPGFPFTLNAAVDALLKKEFDLHRAKNKAHPLMEKYGIDAIPVEHEKLPEWRNNFTGVQYLYEPANFLVFGAIDDLWQNTQGEFLVVDYKATAKREPVTALDQEWHKSYKRQMEIYQWLLRQNGYKVSCTGYFVYCNGKVDRQAFDAKLEFDITIIAYEGQDNWVEGALLSARQCLLKEQAPPASSECDYCTFRQAAAKALL